MLPFFRKVTLRRKKVLSQNEHCENRIWRLHLYVFANHGDFNRYIHLLLCTEGTELQTPSWCVVRTHLSCADILGWPAKISNSSHPEHSSPVSLGLRSTLDRILTQMLAYCQNCSPSGTFLAQNWFSCAHPVRRILCHFVMRRYLA